MPETDVTPPIAASPELDQPVVVDNPPQPEPAAAPVVDTPAPSSKIKILRRGDQVIDTPTEPTHPTEEPPAATPPVEAATPASSEPISEPVEEEVDFFPYAAEQTQGLIKSPEDVFAIVEERNNLKKQLAEKPKLEFPNEQAKWLYEQAIRFPGKEQASYRNMLHVLSLPLDTLSDRDKQFEAFAYKHKNFTRDEARKYFDAKYEKNFGDGVLEADAAAQFDHRIQTDEAVETLRKVQEEFDKLEPSKPAAQAEPQGMTAEEIARSKQEVDSVLDHFGGVKYQIFDDPTSLVSVQMEDSDLATIQNWMVDPRNFFEDLTKECTDENGNFSMDDFAMVMFEIKNRGRIREQAFTAGVNYGKLAQIKATKNTSTPKPNDTPPPAPVKKDFNTAFAEAVKGLNPQRKTA